MPQKVTNSNKSIPKSIPKLDFNQNNDQMMIHTESQSAKEEYGNQETQQHLQYVFEEQGSPKTLDNAFMTGESIGMSEKKVYIDDLNLLHESSRIPNLEDQEIFEPNEGRIKSNSINTTKPSSKQTFALNFENLPKADYHAEFISQFQDFSPSWRKECMKMKGFDPKK